MQPSAPASYQLPFVKKEQLTHDTYSFYFDRHAYGFEFLPGQYNRVILPHENPDDRGTSRFFTIASSPLQKDFLMITTKVVQSSYKKALFNLPAGQMVQFWGPTGKFVLHEEEQSPLVFIAGGIGITPFHSMMIYAAEKKLTRPMTLFVSFTVPEEVVYYKELTDIQKNNPSLRTIYTITRPEESTQQWTGETGRINEALLRKFVPELEKQTFYVSGPPPMVDGTNELLLQSKIPEEQIILEKFTGY